jgi:hypothetical protein
MLSSDILVFEYFKKKGAAWATHEKDAVDYLEKKSTNELSAEFKDDSSFNSVISFINSIKNNISKVPSEKEIQEKAKEIDLKHSDLILDLTNKLSEAITNASPSEGGPADSKERTAVSIAALMAVAVILSINYREKRINER